ncbi:transcriptional activator hap3-like [Apium graveolens]|uniref:transcriptional activator hap3-like n=1 Tax=Apium graveolens TaxID=4045 RepID=UPI003D7C08F2
MKRKFQERDSFDYGGEISRQQPRDSGNLLPAEYVLSQMSRMVANDRGISAGAVISIQECVSKFIRFMTTQANTRCMEEKGTTITGEDVLIAMTNHGFYRYIVPLFLYLNHFRAYGGDEHPPLRGDGSERFCKGWSQ